MITQQQFVVDAAECAAVVQRFNDLPDKIGGNYTPSVVAMVEAINAISGASKPALPATWPQINVYAKQLAALLATHITLTSYDTADAAIHSVVAALDTLMGVSGQAVSWPNATNTGPTGALTNANELITVSTPNSVIENLNLNGRIIVKAPGVTIKNCVINPQGTGYAVQIVGISGHYDDQSGPGALIQHCKLLNAGPNGGLIFGPNWTAEYCDIGNTGADAADGNWWNILRYCYIHDLGSAAGAHADGFQSSGGQHVQIVGNYFDIPSHSLNAQTGAAQRVNSCIFLNAAGINDVLIQGNLLIGGNYAIYNGSKAVDVRVIDNMFGPINIDTGEQYGYIYGGKQTCAIWTGNTDSTGKGI